MTSIETNAGSFYWVLVRTSIMYLEQVLVYIVTIPREAIIVHKSEKGSNKLFVIIHRQ